MKSIIIGIILAVVYFILLGLMIRNASGEEGVRIKQYEQRCNTAGGVVAEWTTQGPPHSRTNKRTCVDPKVILEVK